MITISTILSKLPLYTDSSAIDNILLPVISKLFHNIHRNNFKNDITNAFSRFITFDDIKFYVSAGNFSYTIYMDIGTYIDIKYDITDNINGIIIKIIRSVIMSKCIESEKIVTYLNTLNQELFGVEINNNKFYFDIPIIFLSHKIRLENPDDETILNTIEENVKKVMKINDIIHKAFL